MTHDNVQTTRDSYAAFKRGDLQGLREYCAEDMEWESPESVPNGGVTRGLDAVVAGFAALTHDWSEFVVEPDEYIDAGDHVIVRGVQRGTGPGGSMESRYLHLVTFRDGKMVRGEFIADTAKSLAALGQSAGAGALPA
jgi:ketosteroid isomerase-like protein